MNFCHLSLLPLGVALGIALLPQSVHAEYRAALVIGDSEAKAVAAGLENYGFQCVTTENLTEKELSRNIAGWASNIPTNSTALIFFAGAVRRGKAENPTDISFVTGDDRTFAISEAFGILTTQGGSLTNLILAGSVETPECAGDLPPRCLFGYSDPAAFTSALTGTSDLAETALSAKGVVSTLPEGVSIAGKGSVAISPPDKFVPGERAGDEWVNAMGMVFCWCPPGKYTAGSPEGTPGRYQNEEQHEVIINDGFWIGKYEITNSQNVRNRGPKGSDDKNLPLTDMHWDDGRPMASRTLTEEERKAGRLPAGWQYDLPTEDQWEYAARAGTATRYFFGDDMRFLPEHANFADKRFYDTGDIYSNHAHRSLDDGFPGIAPVGVFKANPWGLHDVYGNAYEWCRDQGARGGSWITVPENCRSAYRDRYSSRDNQIYLGYRFVIQPNVPEPEKK